MKRIVWIAALAAVAIFFYYVGRGSTERDGASPDEGRVVFAITDAAASLDDIESILITINEVRVNSEATGWVTVSDAAKQFDLLRLKESGTLAFLAEGSVPAGAYGQIRLAVGKILVISKGKTVQAKLPSDDLKVVGALTVEKGKTSSVTFDFLADQSLHTTGSGTYIFSPVIKVEARTNADVNTSLGNVSIESGTVTADLTVGMTEGGETREGFRLDSDANLEIINDVIRIIPRGESEAAVNVTATTAIETALTNDFLDSVVAIKLTTREGKKVWRVSGTKGADLIHVYVDASTGNVSGTQE